MITLKEVLEKMDERDAKGNPIPFDIVFCTYSRQQKKGGERITITNAVKVASAKKNQPIVDRRTAAIQAPSKNPHHYKNQTRNIMVLASQQIRKVHIRLIEKFNGQQVTW